MACDRLSLSKFALGTIVQTVIRLEKYDGVWKVKDRFDETNNLAEGILSEQFI